MLIAVPASGPFFRLVAGSLRPEPSFSHIPITERAGLVERQRGAGLE